MKDFGLLILVSFGLSPIWALIVWFLAKKVSKAEENYFKIWGVVFLACLGALVILILVSLIFGTSRGLYPPGTLVLYVAEFGFVTYLFGNLIKKNTGYEIGKRDGLIIGGTSLVFMYFLWNIVLYYLLV